MRAMIITAAVVAATLATSGAGSGAQAQSTNTGYPYCLMTEDAQDCSYNSMAQCLASKNGNIDFCEPNNTYIGPSFSPRNSGRASRMPQ